jgi:hypothetical protein
MAENRVKPFSWDAYPEEFTTLILSFVSFKDLTICVQVCQHWNQVGHHLEKTAKFLKDKYLFKWNEFIQFDEDRGFFFSTQFNPSSMHSNFIQTWSGSYWRRTGHLWPKILTTHSLPLSPKAP